MSVKSKTIAKRALGIVAIVCVLFALFGLALVEPNIRLPKLKNLDDSIFNKNLKIVVLDCNQNPIDIYPSNHIDVSIDCVPQHTIDAFVSIEDHRFFEHKGFDIKRIVKAIAKNTLSLKYKEGGSTITQQLIKNTQLSPEKKLSRKLNEIRIAREIERKYTKKQILEKYLNILYFGKNIYGIGNASKQFFDKNVQDLDLSESALLAGIINNPSIYNPHCNIQKALQRRNLVLLQMYKHNKISSQQYEDCIATQITLTGNFDYLNALSKMVTFELNSINKLGENSTVYTDIDAKFTKLAHDVICKYKSHKYDIGYVLIDNQSGNIVSASTTNNLNLYNAPRQPGSTLKPLMVYAPVLQNNLVMPATQVLDKKTVFSNGYCPKNYRDTYKGWTSVEDCLTHSLNIPAVKLLQLNGIAQSKQFASNLGVQFADQDNNLSLALGSMYHGVDLVTLCNAYSTFGNLGVYRKAKIVQQTRGQFNNYDNLSISRLVMRADTAELVTQMLQKAITKGTAKQLDGLGFDLAAKTGTVGNLKGNTDAYCIAYSSRHTLAVWVGASQMPNYIKGGSLPTKIARQLFTILYKENPPPDFLKSGKVVERYINLDKLTNEQTVELAPGGTPDDQKVLSKFSIYNPPLPRPLYPINHDHILQYYVQQKKR